MKMIKAWIEKNLSGCENPRVKGKALTANRLQFSGDLLDLFLFHRTAAPYTISR